MKKDDSNKLDVPRALELKKEKESICEICKGTDENCNWCSIKVNEFEN